MRKGLARLSIALLVLAAPASVWADNLTGASTFLCTAVQTSRCGAEGDCVTAPPWTLNVPQFIIVDLDDKELRTTEASGENRITPLKNVERKEGVLFLQGVQGGRAFSFVIAEETGMASVAMATDGFGVMVFGACTPVPAG